LPVKSRVTTGQAGQERPFKPGWGGTFTRKYAVSRLVWYEPFMLVIEARAREYENKKWRRAWKINLIDRDNPIWDDVYPAMVGAVPLRRPPA
jgi:putative endonuclease